MEAEFNFDNKILVRDLMQCAEKCGNIPKEQYGSRKVKKSIIHTVNKQLLYDVIHLQRQPDILCSNDAKS